MNELKVGKILFSKMEPTKEEEEFKTLHFLIMINLTMVDMAETIKTIKQILDTQENQLLNLYDQIIEYKKFDKTAHETGTPDIIKILESAKLGNVNYSDYLTMKGYKNRKFRIHKNQINKAEHI
jgi:hypothetical protein